MKIPEWITTILFWGLIIGGIVLWRSLNPVVHDPEAEKTAQNDRKAKLLAIELDYEKKFYADEDKDIREGKTRPVLIRVASPDGGSITETLKGRWLFISECPKGYWCAQPDGSLEDENGLDLNNPPSP